MTSVAPTAFAKATCPPVPTFTAVAFGVLAPMLGLGLIGLWGARYGTFPERDDLRGRRSTP